MLQKTHPELLSNIYIVHGADIESAKKLKNDIGLPDNNVSTFGREGLMNEVSPEWRDYRINPKTDNYIIPKKDYTFNDENEIISALGVKDVSSPPSLIIIDEISKFTSYDLDLIDKYARKYGITVLVAGDFDQSGVIGEHSITINNKDYKWRVSLNRTQFIRTLKLGVSLRTDNSIKTVNLQKVQTYMQHKDYSLPISLDYYQDESGIYGDKVIQYGIEIYRDESNNISEVTSDKQLQLKQVLTEVDNLIKTLKEGEKIGYIYNDRSSPIYSELASDKYSQYIDFKKGGKAQGLEGRYYIIEMDPDLNRDRFLHDMYTGMSRSQQGSIIITPSSQEKSVINISSKRQSDKIDEPVTKASIATYADNRKKLLSRVVSGELTDQYIPRDKESNIISAVRPINNGLISGVDPTPPPISDTYMQIKSKLLNDISNATTIEQLSKIQQNIDSKLVKDDEILTAIKTQTDRITTSLKTSIPIESFDSIPGEFKEDLVIASKVASSNPDTENGLDLDDSKSDIKYGDIVKIYDGYGVVVGIKSGKGNALTTYKVLRPTSRTNDNKWGYEAWPYFQTQIDALIKVPETINEQKTEALIYEDDATPLTNTDIIPQSEYYNQIDNSNESTELPQSELIIENQDSPIGINMQMYTFNTFETGVLRGENGEVVPAGDQKHMDVRIDSTNGLVKIDKLLGNQTRTYDEYVKILGRLRNIIFNTDDKANICEKISKLLNIPNIYCTFALKSSPRPSNNNKNQQREFVGNTPTRFDKGISEYTEFNGSSDTRSKEWHQKSIVAIFGTDKDGDLLELPLIALSSPLTIIHTQGENKSYPFQPILDRINSLRDQKTLEETIQNLLQESDNEFLTNLLNRVQKYGVTDHAIYEVIAREFKNIPKFKNIANLFELYNYTDGGIFYIENNSWTPLKDLELLGPSFTKNRGYYQELEGFNYDADDIPETEWVNLSDFSNRPDIYITKNVLISRTGMVDSGNTTLQIAKPGHPFVLISFDRSLNNDLSVIDYYKKQLTDNSTKKKVKLVYVSKPKATIREYLDNLHKILNNDPEVHPIGQLFTSYKLLNILMQYPEFRNRLNSKNKNLVAHIDQALDELNSLETIQEKKDRLYQTEQWSGVGLSTKPLKLAGLFDGVLVKASYDLNTLNRYIGLDNYSRPNEEGIQLIERILAENNIDGIYYNVKISRKNPQTIGSLDIPIQGKGYTLDNNPFKIHGKIDSYTFRGNMDFFIEQALSKLKWSDRGYLHRYSTDSTKYLKGNSNLNSSAKTKEQIQIENTIKYVKDKVGLDFSGQFMERTYQDTINEIASNINTNENISAVAFIVNNQLQISNSNDYLKYNLKLQTLDGVPINQSNITSLIDNNGVAKFNIQAYSRLNRVQTYSAEYNFANKTLTLVSEVEMNTNQPTLSVNETTYFNYRIVMSEVLEDIFKYDKDLEEVFKNSDYNSFIDYLQNEYIYDGDNRISDLEEAKTKTNDSQIKTWLDELIEFERSQDPDKSDSQKQACPLNIIIKF